MTSNVLIWISRTSILVYGYVVGSYVKVIVDPYSFAQHIGVSGDDGITPATATYLRMGFGATHFALGLVAAYCAFRPDLFRFIIGVGLTNSLVVTAVRLLGMIEQGTTAQLHLLTLEVCVTSALLIGLAADRRRRGAGAPIDSADSARSAMRR